jgi:hypothetical protein
MNILTVDAYISVYHIAQLLLKLKVINVSQWGNALARRADYVELDE